MPLMRIQDLDLSFGPRVILEKAQCQLFKGDRACLVGRNGAGKSTFMKIVDSLVKPDSGEVWFRPGIKIGRLEQELPAADDRTVKEVVSSGLADVGLLLAEYDKLAVSDMDDAALKRLSQLQQELEAKDGWSLQQRVDEIITRLDLPEHQTMNNLSGGWRRRVALGQALVAEPDILLLDEPTNHLDIETIRWLEEKLQDFAGAILFITHDRALARSLSNKIFELDRGILTEFNTGYDAYLEEKAHLLEVEERNNALFDKKLAQEEVWIRQGIKARRTRNEGRVRALKKLREERADRREQTGKATLQLEESSKSGKIVAELKDVSVSFDKKQIIKNLTLKVMRGDKIGLLGPNGSGKSTLLKTMLGELEPNSGSVKMGTKLDIAYYDQMRAILDPEATVIDTVSQGRDSITINGKDQHIISYLGKFLFSAERARTPLKALSGGERNRVQLALLFSQPANLLVLDEPTNDLDLETLELLEALLLEFQGTILLVSHDRAFMDNVVTSTLAFMGNGNVEEYVGGYDDWLRQSGGFPKADNKKPATVKSKSAEKPTPSAKESEPASPEQKPVVKPKKLSYKLQRELEELPELIESLEQQQEALQLETSAPEFYQQDPQKVEEKLKELAAVDEKLQTAYDRWVELSE